MTRIVVGVDGSPNSRRALRRAVEEAELRGGSVDAIYVYPPAQRSWSDDLIGLAVGAASAIGSVTDDGPAHHPPSREQEAHDQAQSQLEQFVAEALGEAPAQEPRLMAITAGHPAEALIEQSRTADMLVIGTRGRGGFGGMLLGSVAHQCIQRSHCPVLILPPEKT